MAFFKITVALKYVLPAPNPTKAFKAALPFVYCVIVPSITMASLATSSLITTFSNAFVSLTEDSIISVKFLEADLGKFCFFVPSLNVLIMTESYFDRSKVSLLFDFFSSFDAVVVFSASSDSVC